MHSVGFLKSRLAVEFCRENEYAADFCEFCPERSKQEEMEKLELRAKPVLRKAVSDEEVRRQLAVKGKLVVSLQTELSAQKQESGQERGAQVKAAYNLGKKQELARVSATSNASTLVDEVQSNGTGVSVAELQKQAGVMAVLRAEKDALKSRVLALEKDVRTLNSTRVAEGLDASAGNRSMSGDAERQRYVESENICMSYHNLRDRTF